MISRVRPHSRIRVRVDGRVFAFHAHRLELRLKRRCAAGGLSLRLRARRELGGCVIGAIVDERQGIDDRARARFDFVEDLVVRVAKTHGEELEQRMRNAAPVTWTRPRSSTLEKRRRGDRHARLRRAKVIEGAAHENHRSVRSRA